MGKDFLGLIPAIVGSAGLNKPYGSCAPSHIPHTILALRDVCTVRLIHYDEDTF